MDLTDMRVEVQVTVDADPGAVWDLLADVTNVGAWSPECVQATWSEPAAGPRPGARFTAVNRVGDLEWSVTGVVTEADRPGSFAWAVLDDAGDVDRPSSRWRYDLEQLANGRTRVSQRFVHGPGGSGVKMMIAKDPEKAERIIEYRRDRLRSNMLETLAAAAQAAADPAGSRPSDPRG